jgi:hypothetical protein
MIIQDYPGSGYLTPATSKFTQYLLEDPAKFGLHHQDIPFYQFKNLLHFSKMPVMENIKEQAKVIKLGSGVILELDGKFTFNVLIDGVVVLKNAIEDFRIVTPCSNLGKALLNNPCGCKGHYNEGGHFHNFKIKKIIPYSKAKMFYKKEEVLAM